MSGFVSEPNIHPPLVNYGHRTIEISENTSYELDLPPTSVLNGYWLGRLHPDAAERPTDVVVQLSTMADRLLAGRAVVCAVSPR
jgi:hypothetical protein